MGKFHMAWIGMADYSSSKIIPVAQSGFPKNYLENLNIKFDDSPERRGISGTAIKTGKNITSGNIETDKRFSKWRKEAKDLGYRASAAFPLRLEKKIIGVINVHFLDGDELNKDVIALLDELAGDISLALRLMAQSEARKNAEQLLMLANKVIENSPAVLFRWKAERELPVDFVSHNVEQFGYTQQELIDGTVMFADMIHPDDSKRVIREINKNSKAGHKNFRLEFRLVNKKDKIFWVDGRVNIIRDRKRKIIFYEGIVIDISEKKKAEIALWESNNMLSLVIDNIPIRIFWKDKNFRYLGCNKLLLKDAGLKSSNDIIGKTDFEVAWKKYAPRFRKEDEKIVENIIPELNYEQNFSTDNGEIWLQIKKIPFKDRAGNIIGLLGTYENITEKKYAGEALKESEERLRLALKSAKQGLYDLNVETGDAIVSAEYAAMLGYSPRSFKESNDNWLKRLHPDDHTETLKKYSDYISGKIDEYSVEFRQKTKSNKWVWVLSQGKIVEWNDKGKPVRMLGTHTNITDRKTAEKALQESELRYKYFVDQTSDGFYRLGSVKPIKLNDKDISASKISFGSFYVLECNEVLASMYGFKSAEDMKGLFLYEIQKDWNEELSIRAFEEFLQNNLKMINIETMEYDKQGNQKYFRNNYVGIVNNKMLVEIWGTQQDITEQKKANEAIKESEKRFRSLFEHSAMGVAQIYTGSGKFYRVNKKYASILGYKMNEMLDLTFQKITHPDDYEKDKDNMRKLREGSINEFSVEKRYFHKNGSIVWVDVTVSPLWEPNEKKEFHMAVAEDITEKRKAQIALRESAEQYRLLFAGNPNPMFVWDRETFKFLDANEAAVNHYGYSHKEFLEMTIKDIRPKEDIPAMMKVVSRLDDGITRSTGYRHKKKNGEIIHVEVTSNSVLFNNRQAEVVVVYDITEKHIAEQALKESEQKFRSVFADSHDCIYVASVDGKLININDAGLQLFKINRDEVDETNVAELYSKTEDRLKFIEKINRKGFVKDYSVKLKDTMNFELDCLITASVKKDADGKILSYQGIIRDITEQKKSEKELVLAKEQAERANRVKTEFLAQMSHEIRTPINTLLSFSSLIREELQEHLTEDLKQYFQFQLSAGNRIIRTIDLVLNMSEIQTGSFELSTSEFNLADLIAEIYNDYKSIAEQNGLVINLFSQEDSLIIKADEYSVHQIFSNLIDNSIKYTPDGSITLTAKKENKKAIIEVIDTGIGMTEEYLRNIFQPFTQEEQGYTRKFEGSGLGLSLVKKYCDFNNAAISVESKKNIGSKFIVSFNLMK
jgi:PAS domain S-box-containing protein